MKRSRVLSIRVDAEKVAILEEAGIDVKAEIKELIDRLVWRIMIKRRVNRLANVIKKLPSTEDGFSEREVRADREGH